MLAPFILVLLTASGLLILVGWASEAVSASMRYGQGYPITPVRMILTAYLENSPCSRSG
jgi:hypothetical protein